MAEVSDLGAFGMGLGTGGFNALAYRNRQKKDQELKDEELRGRAMRNVDFLKNIQHEADQESARLAYDLDKLKRESSTPHGQAALRRQGQELFQAEGQQGISGAAMPPVSRYAALEGMFSRMSPDDREQVLTDFEIDKYEQASKQGRKSLGQRVAASARTGAYSRENIPGDVDPEMQAVIDEYAAMLEVEPDFASVEDARDYADKLAAATEAEALIRVKFNKEKALIQQKVSITMSGAALMADLQSKGFDVTPMVGPYSLFLADQITAEQYQRAMAGAKVVPVELNADGKDPRPAEQREFGRRAQFVQASGGVTAGPGSSPQVPTNGVPRGTEQPDANRQQTFKQLVQQVTAGAGIEETANALGLDPDGFTEDETAILEAVLGGGGE